TPDGGMSYVQRDVRPGEIRTYARNEAIGDVPYDGPGLGMWVRGIVTGRWDGAQELRTLSEGSSFPLVPTPLSNPVINIMRNKAQVINAGAVTIPMESQTLKCARQTTDVTAGWKSENAALSYSDAAFDSVTFTAQMLIAGSKLSIELCEDAQGIDAVVENS